MTREEIITGLHRLYDEFVNMKNDIDSRERLFEGMNLVHEAYWERGKSGIVTSCCNRLKAFIERVSADDMSDINDEEL